MMAFLMPSIMPLASIDETKTDDRDDAPAEVEAESALHRSSTLRSSKRSSSKLLYKSWELTIVQWAIMLKTYEQYSLQIISWCCVQQHTLRLELDVFGAIVMRTKRPGHLIPRVLQPHSHLDGVVQHVNER
mmetsp:Transcript_6711/g.12692  ORF Transcript_6711/g.12692 Transcript_6711/m.12692 type:complete len:131 (+) Transcript_6711:192-584(+)